MLCTINPRKGAGGIGTCIDNRTAGPCGPAGKQFKKKVLNEPDEQQ